MWPAGFYHSKTKAVGSLPYCLPASLLERAVATTFLPPNAYSSMSSVLVCTAGPQDRQRESDTDPLVSPLASVPTYNTDPTDAQPLDSRGKGLGGKKNEGPEPSDSQCGGGFELNPSFVDFHVRQQEPFQLFVSIAVGTWTSVFVRRTCARPEFRRCCKCSTRPSLLILDSLVQPRPSSLAGPANFAVTYCLPPTACVRKIKRGTLCFHTVRATVWNLQRLRTCASPTVKWFLKHQLFYRSPGWTGLSHVVNVP
jgi:hypothetical protein